MPAITTTYKPRDRAAWRAWLEAHHAIAEEIWLLLDDVSGQQTLSYLDAVEEAICFGWIDSIQKRFSPTERAQRFSPRRRRSRWSELNKERARRLIRLGLMTEAGHATLPDLDAPFVIADDIVAAIKADPDAWRWFSEFPALYVRVHIGNIEGLRRNPDDFTRRLAKFIQKTAAGTMFGDWNDRGRLG